MQAKEGVLGRVLGLVQATEEPQRRPQDHPLMPLDEKSERPFVSCPGAPDPLGDLRRSPPPPLRGGIGWRQIVEHYAGRAAIAFETFGLHGREEMGFFLAVMATIGEIAEKIDCILCRLLV